TRPRIRSAVVSVRLCMVRPPAGMLPCPVPKVSSRRVAPGTYPGGRLARRPKKLCEKQSGKWGRWGAPAAWGEWSGVGGEDDRPVAVGVDHAEEAERTRPGRIAKLVNFLRGDVDDVARLQRVDGGAELDLAPAAEHHHGVFVDVLLQRGE